MRAQVVARLNRRLSPEQVSADLARCFPGRDDMRVSTETIYHSLYVQGRGALRQELCVAKALRSGRKGRKPRSRLPARGRRPWIAEGTRISDRPAEAADRAVPGHWEGDLIIGGGDQRTCLITLVERSSRFVLISRLGVHDAHSVADRLTAMFSGLPAQIARSLTWDQGVKMAACNRFTVATGVKVYFCDPHSPWQRGSNENTNGLIRDFFPKGTDFSTVTDVQVAEAQRLLNLRPRKTLDWLTPAEKLEAYIKDVALTT